MSDIKVIALFFATFLVLIVCIMGTVYFGNYMEQKDCLTDRKTTVNPVWCK
jgi:uncharacterized membrane protein